ncbi:hypothetical protein [Methanobacterium sp. MBAC-LM]|uniref:hypothetical protein n=1 Tax=Methanobacterium sp. MBAC-LM TaxID=3412034 RepID=UPI003C782738
MGGNDVKIQMLLAAKTLFENGFYGAYKTCPEDAIVNGKKFNDNTWPYLNCRCIQIHGMLIVSAMMGHSNENILSQRYCLVYG